MHKRVLALPNCSRNKCLEKDDNKIIVVIDDAKAGRSIIDRSGIALPYPKFTIKNPKKFDIHVLAIDNCIYDGNDGKKCDFAAFNQNEIHFVELKRGLSTNKSTRRKQATEQLKATLLKVNGKLDFSGYTKYACVCVGYASQVPAALASNLPAQVEFKIVHDTILRYGNEIEFL